MYKLIACDLDETLLNTDKEICARNIAAIKRAEREYGVRFVPATGRGYTVLIMCCIRWEYMMLNRSTRFPITAVL